MTIHIAFLVYDRLTALDLVGPYEVLSGLPDVTLQFVAKQAGPVAVDTGAFSLVAPLGLADVTRADVLVVPGSSSGTLDAANDAALIDWIRAIDRTTRFTTSVCSGAILLGAAGLLAAKPATTHWAAMPFLPHFGAEARPDERIVHSGKIITAAGVSAGIDMGLYLAGQLAGAEAAQAAQLLIEYDPMPPFQAGHMSKASSLVKELATRAMARAASGSR
jgi:transcriptional regulator GlxA family with amidase domain